MGLTKFNVTNYKIAGSVEESYFYGTAEFERFNFFSANEAIEKKWFLSNNQFVDVDTGENITLYICDEFNSWYAKTRIEEIEQEIENNQGRG